MCIYRERQTDRERDSPRICLSLSIYIEREKQREDYTHLLMSLYGYISLYIYLERQTERERLYTHLLISLYILHGICVAYVCNMQRISGNMYGNVRDIYVWGMYGVCMQYSVLSLPRPLFKQQQTPKSEQFEEGLKNLGPHPSEILQSSIFKPRT